MYALIINQQVSQYPYSIDRLRSDNPQTSFPGVLSDDVLASFGVFPVKESDHHAFDPLTQRIEEVTPVLIGGEWVQAWTVVALNAEEVAAQQLALRAAIVEKTQQRLDDFARTRGYDGILSACTYATSKVPKFAAEGQYCVEARDATWAALYQILAEVQSVTRPVPSGFADIDGDLPALVWPS